MMALHDNDRMWYDHIKRNILIYKSYQPEKRSDQIWPGDIQVNVK